MMLRTQKRWTLVALLGICYWFFGNLYEQIVISPNWVEDSPEQMRRLNEFFVNTSPTHYFVPLTQLATVLIWILYFTNKQQNVMSGLRRASVFAVLDTLLTIFIVSTIVIKLFGENYLEYQDDLNSLAWRWNFLNIVRMLLTAMVAHHLFSVYRILDKMEAYSIQSIDDTQSDT